MTDGPLRPIAITATPHPMGRYGLTDLLITVNGVESLGQWSTRGVWHVPAESSTNISIAMRNAGSRKHFGGAQLVLPSGGPTELEYKPPAFFAAPGALGPSGTVVHNGITSYAKFIGIAVAIAVVVGAAIAVGLLLDLQ